MTTCRNRRLAAAILCTLATFSNVATAETNYDFNLPQQPLADALRAIGRLTTTSILFEPATVENLTAPAVSGQLSPEEAIQRVLAGTKLVVEHTAADSLLITPASARATPTAARPVADDQSAGADSAAGLKLEGSMSRIEEVVVTAQKRAESSLVVPMGLTALSGEQLESEQAYRLEDFVGKVPGLNVSESVGSQLVVRGIASSSGSINAPVATYIDETPLVGVGAFSGGFANTPNLDTFDVARVEVLKGPQGTLYGANALGGLLKYVTNAPDTSGFAAKVQAGASTVAHNDDGAGYNVHGMVNVPIADDLALRVVGYHNEYPGFIDDPGRGREDMNEYTVSGGRASLLWSPTQNFSLRLNVLAQDREWGGVSYQDSAPGTLAPVTCSLCQSRDVDQPGDSTLRYYNATINWDLGPASLLSSTTYYESEFRQENDLTPQVGAIVDFLFQAPPGTYGLWAQNDYRGEEYVHETRLASNSDGDWNWQAGIYYTSKETILYQPQRLIDRANNVILQNALSLSVGGSVLPATYKELAGFVNIGYRFTDTFDVTVGGRISENSQTFEQIGAGFSPSAPNTPQSESVFTYSADARWRFTPNNMVYVRVAEGFAPGGPNVAAFNQPIPPAYGSSSTTNYEIGYKSTLLEQSLTLELAAFQIDWEDIQVVVPFGVYTSIDNGGKAVSRGFEAALTYVPVAGLTLGLNGAYTDAKLTEDTPSGAGGRDGERLPISPRWQGAFSADYKRPLFGDFTGFIGLDWRYLGSRLAEFEPVNPRHEMPSYDIVDLRLGVQTTRWTLGVYGKNLGDTVPLNYVNDATTVYGLQRAYVGTPRTIGVEVTTSF